MFVSAAFSEIRELNQNKKKNSEIDYFQFKTFTGQISYPFFNQRYFLSTCVHSNLGHPYIYTVLPYCAII